MLEFDDGNYQFMSFQPQFIFKSGRHDCPTSPNTATNRSLPLASFDYNGVIDFYRRYERMLNFLHIKQDMLFIT